MKTKAIILTSITLIVTMGLLVFSLSGINTADQNSHLKIGGFTIAPYAYSVSLNHEADPTQYYRISPFDDAIIYQQFETYNELDKVTEWEEDVTNLRLTANTSNTYWQLPASIRPRIATAEFEANGKRPVTFIAFAEGNDLVITKRISGLTKPAIGYTHFVSFNQTDVIFDSNFVAYTQKDNQPLLDALKLTAAQQDNEIDYVSQITFLAIFNPHTRQAILVPTDHDSYTKVYVDHTYQLIGVDELFDNPQQNSFSVQQILKLSNISDVLPL